MLGHVIPSCPRSNADQGRLDKSKRGHSLAFRMAYTAGYEAITYQLVGFMMDERARWLTGADPDVLGLLCWHGAEEVEHKTVAYDAFQAVHGGWAMRARGLLSALLMTVKDIREMAQMMIKADGLWDDAQARRRLRKVASHSRSGCCRASGTT